ncbi:unnamed protein product [Penicillium salamii]|nr:unnamed protein product [Penicillium salamii]
MCVFNTLITLSILFSPAISTDLKDPTGRPGHGFIGYGISVYDPVCATTCAEVVPTRLQCPKSDDGGSYLSTPSPECLATNEPYLTSMAWCIHVHCGDEVEIFNIESWWRLNIPGRQVDQPVPKMTYQHALSLIETPPTEILEKGAVLNRTVTVSNESYNAHQEQQTVYKNVQTNSSKYGLIIFITGCVAPIFLSLIRFIPLPSQFFIALNAHLIDPPLAGKRHAVPVLGAGIVPTRGQALFIAYIVIVNIILSSVGYQISRPGTMYPNLSYQLAAWVSNRLGVLSFANLPLLILYSGRNNILLWMTDWSRSTFLLIHRWIAFICTLQACLHSLIYLALVIWENDHEIKSHLAFWYWGIIATVAFSLMIPFSILPLRRVAYELFFILHIAFAILAIAGSWYHIMYRYDRQWGFETWLYMAMAIWSFDRLMRLARIARFGLNRAFVTEVDDRYLRIEIPNVICRGHAYFCFPTLTWRFWDSHPFSIIPQTSFHESDLNVRPKDGNESVSEALQTDTQPKALSYSPPASFNSERRGIVLYVGRHTGITSLLASRAGSVPGLPVLIESAYSNPLGTAGHFQPTAEYPNTVCIVGGVGITAILPFLLSQSSIQTMGARTKLYWGSRSQALVDSVRSEVGPQWSHIDQEVSVGQRFDIKKVLSDELLQSGSTGTTVMVCGPSPMSDDVRFHISALGRHGARVRLAEESFGW